MPPLCAVYCVLSASVRLILSDTQCLPLSLPAAAPTARLAPAWGGGKPQPAGTHVTRFVVITVLAGRNSTVLTLYLLGQISPISLYFSSINTMQNIKSLSCKSLLLPIKSERFSPSAFNRRLLESCYKIQPRVILIIRWWTNYPTQSSHPTLNLSKIYSRNNFYTFPDSAEYSILNTDHSEDMGGKIESDANMNNQRINLNKLTVDLLSHYLHSDPMPSHLYIQFRKFR